MSIYTEDHTETLIQLLEKIKPGETINLTTREIVYHKSWYGVLTRTWYGENRVNLERYIDQIMRQELSDYQTIFRKDLKRSQRQKIIAALSGIRNICVTYAGTETAANLSKLVSEIESKLYIEDTRSVAISIPNVVNGVPQYSEFGGCFSAPNLR